MLSATFLVLIRPKLDSIFCGVLNSRVIPWMGSKLLLKNTKIIHWTFILPISHRRDKIAIFLSFGEDYTILHDLFCFCDELNRLNHILVFFCKFLFIFLNVKLLEKITSLSLTLSSTLFLWLCQIVFSFFRNCFSLFLLQLREIENKNTFWTLYFKRNQKWDKSIYFLIQVFFAQKSVSWIK